MPVADGIGALTCSMDLRVRCHVPGSLRWAVSGLRVELRLDGATRWSPCDGLDVDSVIAGLR